MMFYLNLKLTCAKIRSLVFFVDIQIKHIAGNTTHIIIPMVEPTRPKTSSIFGIITPITSETKTIRNVRLLNRPSGMYLSVPPSCNA